MNVRFFAFVFGAFSVFASIGVSSANAGFYAGGSLIYSGNRYIVDDSYMADSANFHSLGGEASIGYLALKEKYVFGAEGFANIAANSYKDVGTHEYNVLLPFSNSYDRKFTNRFAFGLVGKGGVKISESTIFYGRLGVAMQDIKYSETNDIVSDHASGFIDAGMSSKLQTVAIAGLGMETKMRENVNLFVEYDFYIPFAKKPGNVVAITADGASGVGDFKASLSRQVFKVGLKYYFKS